MTLARSLSPAGHLWQVGLDTPARASYWLVLPVWGSDPNSLPEPPPGIRTVPADWPHVTLGPGPARALPDPRMLPGPFSVSVMGISTTDYSVRVALAPSTELDDLRHAFATDSVHASKSYYVTLAYAVRPTTGPSIAAWAKEIERSLAPEVRLGCVEERRAGDLGAFKYTVLRRWVL